MHAPCRSALLSAAEVNEGEDETDDRTQRPVTLVVFLGGCTASELACLRFLSKQHRKDLYRCLL